MQELSPPLRTDAADEFDGRSKHLGRGSVVGAGGRLLAEHVAEMALMP